VSAERPTYTRLGRSLASRSHSPSPLSEWQREEQVISTRIKFTTAVGLAVLLTMAAVSPANADDPNDVSAVDVQVALAGVEGGLVADAVNTEATADEAAVAASGDNAVSVPRDASEGVTVEVDGQELTIGLPDVESAGSAVALTSGAVAYPGDSGVANTVIPIADGVQVLTTIAGATASETFEYALEVPAGAAVKLAGDGSAIVVGADDVPLVTTTAPWAVDANGQSVPTHYEVRGSTLIQVVEHQDAGFAYPIVADPTYTYWWGGKTWVPANAVNVQQVAAALAAFIAVAPAAIVSAGLGLCNQAGKGIWVYWTWAGHVWCTGP